MSTITVRCPHCKRNVRGDQSVAGRVVKCQCGGKFRFPMLSMPSTDDGEGPPPEPSPPEPEMHEEELHDEPEPPEPLDDSALATEMATDTLGDSVGQGVHAFGEILEVSRDAIPKKLRRYLATNEELRFAFRPSWASLVLTWVRLGLWAALGFLTTAGVAFTRAPGDRGVILATNLVVWGIGVAYACVVAYLGWQNTGYVVTDKRFMGRQGVLSVRWVVMPIANITSIDINTGFLDRLFGLETLVVSAAASAPGLRAMLKGATRGSLTCWGVHANTTEQFMAAMYGAMGG